MESAYMEHYCLFIADFVTHVFGIQMRTVVENKKRMKDE